MWATNILFSFSTLSSQTSSSSCCDAVGSGTGWRGSSSSGACHLLRNHLAPLCRSRRDWPTLTVERYFTPVSLSLSLSAPARTVLWDAVSSTQLLCHTWWGLPCATFTIHIHSAGSPLKRSTYSYIVVQSLIYVGVKLGVRVCLQTVEWS